MWKNFIVCQNRVFTTLLNDKNKFGTVWGGNGNYKACQKEFLHVMVINFFLNSSLKDNMTKFICILKNKSTCCVLIQWIINTN